MKNIKLCAILIFAFITLTNAQWLETTIAVGDEPRALVYNPTNNKVYCANYDSDNVTVIDGATNAVITTIAVGDEPCALAYNPTDNKVYCANWLSDNVTVIDGATNAVITTITVGAGPYALVYNPTNNKVYCANWYSGNVTVIDGATNAVITTIPVGVRPCALVYNPTNNKVYCANYASDNVTVIDGATNAVITTITVGSIPRALVYNPTNNKAYCANRFSDNVTVIDGATNTVITTIAVGDYPRALVYNPTHNKVYCANWDSDNVTVIDGATNAVITTIGVGDGPRAFAWNPVQNRTYVANFYSSSVSVIRDGGETTPPLPFNLISPSDLAILAITRPTFIWEASFDSISGLMNYEVYINDTLRHTCEDTFWTADYDLSQGWHNWYIVAYDSAANSRQSNQTWLVLIDTEAPSVVTLISPSDGAYLNDSIVNFIWYQSTDTLSGVDYYVLQYTPDSTFSSGVVETTLVDTMSTAVLSDTTSGTTYYWRVKAVDVATNESEWSSVWYFEMDTQAPNPPVLISPIGGVYFSDTLVDFEWSAVTVFSRFNQSKNTDAERGSRGILFSPIRYILQVDTTTVFTSPLVIDTLTSTSTTISLNEDFYYWRVKAYDLAGNQGSYAQPDSFGVDITPPVIESTTVWTDTSYAGPFEIRTKVIDNLSDVDSVILYYKRNEDPDWISTTMYAAGLPDWYLDSIPPVANPDDTVRYYIEAVDEAEPANAATDPAGAPANYYWFIANFTGVEELKQIPQYFSFGLQSNPARGRAVFNLAIPEDAEITLRIYDVLGRLIDKPITCRMSAGIYEIVWTTKVSAGVYFYCLESTWQKIVRKLVLLR